MQDYAGGVYQSDRARCCYLVCIVRSIHRYRYCGLTVGSLQLVFSSVARYTGLNSHGATDKPFLRLDRGGVPMWMGWPGKGTHFAISEIFHRSE